MIEAPGDVDALKNFQPIRTQFDKYLPKSFRGDLVVCGSDPSHCDAVKDNDVFSYFPYIYDCIAHKHWHIY